MADSEQSGGPLRVLLVDDEALVREGLAMLLDAEPDLQVVGEAGSGAQALTLAGALHPEVVVMDVRMPGMDGVEVTRALVADGFAADPRQTIRVLVLSSFHDDAAVHGALRCGASGFLLKSAAMRDLSAAIRTVAEGNSWLDPVVAKQLIADFAARPDPGLPTPEEMSALTAREREVLVLLAHGFGTGEIAEQLVITEATGKTHIGRILNKLGLRDRAQAVAAAYKSGLVRPGDAAPARRG